MDQADAILSKFCGRGYGNLASVLGLLLSLVGFIITIWTVLKTRSAAEAARQAASDTSARIQSQTLSVEIGTLLQIARDLERSCRGQDWGKALDRCGDMRTQLARLAKHPGLENEERKSLDDVLEQVSKIMEALQTARRAAPPASIPEPRPFPDKHLKSVNGLIVMLSKIQGRLQFA